MFDRFVLSRLLCLSVGVLTGFDTLHAQTVDWTQEQPRKSPSERFSSGMAFDYTLGRTLLFGGYDNMLVKLNDTWVWHNGWSQLDPATSPPPRQGPGMVWDGKAKNIVLFGGLNSSGQTCTVSSECLNDTWTWDGTTWTQQFPPVSPPGRYFDGEGMTYDAATGNVVLFGGAGLGTSIFFGDTWIWDGVAKTWTQQFPELSPSPRKTTIAYDYTAKTVVLFGGNNAAVDFDDTWIWDGDNWRQKFPLISPSPRTMGSMAWDNNLGLIVLFGGGRDLTPIGDTWVWREKTWDQVDTESTPPARWAAPVDYDPVSRGLLVFGGVNSLDDTWVFLRVP